MSDAPFLTPEEEFAQLQKLSNEYEPEVTGPLVGDRQSSSAIATEYANADPVYRVKTQALPAKYAFFRTCRGDGHCGWRAIAFGYFEALLHVGDVAKFDVEEARLISMNNLLNLAGFSEDVYIDFAEEAYDLLRKLGGSLQLGNGPSLLLEAFNDMGVSMAIITYVKLLASAWIQSRAEEYQNYLQTDVKSYCSQNIEAAVCEIDDVAVAALSEALVKPAGIGLEILYLDRSIGDEVNAHAISQPMNFNGLLPMIRLLYRPGHYDILYKAEDLPAPPQQAPIHVALAYSNNHSFEAASPDANLLSMIPGMYSHNRFQTMDQSFGQRWAPATYDFDPTPAPQPQITPVQPYAPAPPAPVAPISVPHQDFMSPLHASPISHHSPGSHHSLQMEQQPVSLPFHSAPPPPVSIDRTPITVERGGPFRPSMYELEPGFGTGEVLPFQTNIFRNSHFNTCHFMNPSFQPEEWSPHEYRTGNKGKHKSVSQ
ncbi:cysteine proteinase [Karstenula rhodostoma CBS 690.94]|uniref:ubiquitinyl hydrolase 1 n=1 Tax=Karstenula rhodostoma CBS 690.94 TaxID=1392251 RepID=A0A9P4PB26_9PLEO|nr:cysteine proteinase [Karstenula rhodostoma CBS 690.94]